MACSFMTSGVFQPNAEYVNLPETHSLPFGSNPSGPDCFWGAEGS